MTVRAAGAIVVRQGQDAPEILLVHRPRYDDWSFPKGKAKKNESDEECALRELEEEACVRAALGPELGRTRYRDSRGRPKEVVYFRAETDEEPGTGDGVDEVRWSPVDEALRVLTWERDRELLDAARNRL